MTDLTDYTEGQFIDWCFGGTDMPAAHGSVYVALHTEDPTESGDVGEVSASDYGRVETVAGSDWTTSGGQAENANEVLFTAGSDWGTITHFSLWDAASGGNPLWHSAVEPEKPLGTDDELSFSAGSLTVAID